MLREGIKQVSEDRQRPFACLTYPAGTALSRPITGADRRFSTTARVFTSGVWAARSGQRHPHRVRRHIGILKRAIPGHALEYSMATPGT